MSTPFYDAIPALGSALVVTALALDALARTRTTLNRTEVSR